MDLLVHAANYLLVGFTCVAFYQKLARPGLISKKKGCLFWTRSLFMLVFTLSAMGFDLVMPPFLSGYLALVLCGLLQKRYAKDLNPLPVALLLFSFIYLTAELLIIASRTLLGLIRPGDIPLGDGALLELAALGAASLVVALLYHSPLPGKLKLNEFRKHAAFLSISFVALSAATFLFGGNSHTSGYSMIGVAILLLITAALCFFCMEDQRQDIRQKAILKKELNQKIQELDAKIIEAQKLHEQIHDYRDLVQSNKSRVEEMAQLVNRFPDNGGQFNAEFAEEFETLRNNTLEIYRLTEQTTAKDFLGSQVLPKTGFPQLDDLLGGYLKLCIENHIFLNLSVLTPFDGEYRPREVKGPLLARTIAEHVLDAIRAVERGGQEEGEIDITMGFLPKEKCYGIDISDNGEPFRLEILGELGADTGVTTGGSGIGFPTTLKRLALCNGSLVVQDWDPDSHGSMAACVSILFDGLRRFEIRSDYRQAEIDALRKAREESGLLFFTSASTKYDEK